MNVRITKADESRLRACHEVFLDSALYDHYFSQEGRLDRQLSTAISRGELWIALTSQDEVAGCMWMEPDGFFGAFPYLALLGVKKSFRGMGVGTHAAGDLHRRLPVPGLQEVLPAGESLQPPGQEPLSVPGVQKGGLCARLHPPRHP